MKHFVALSIALAVVWWVWSAHAEPFMLFLGGLSVLAVSWLCHRMRIIDDQSVPVWLGLRPFTHYLPWLVREIVIANVQVTKLILEKEISIQPTMIEIRPTQKTELGRVILANSITLTPGTVSVDLQPGRLRIHALSPSDAESDASGGIDQRVTQLERRRLE